MGASFLIQSANGALAVEVSRRLRRVGGREVDATFAEGSTIAGNLLGGGDGHAIPRNQSWQVTPDPLGSGHYLIVSSTSGLCIGLGANVAVGADATDDATDRGAVLTLQVQQYESNHYQVWDFVPPSVGPENSAFIQNPQTGYVMELESHSTEPSPLVVNPRRISNDTYQLWSAVDADGNDVGLPVVSMATQAGLALHGFVQYVLLPPDQAHNLTGITVTIDVIEDVVVGGCSIQINCNAPFIGSADNEDYDRDAQWMQFGLFMQNNQLTLFNQTWHRLGPVPASEFPSGVETSPLLLQLQDNTIAAGTRIIMNLCTDQDDFVIGIAGLALDNTGLPIGNPIFWPALGRDSFHVNVDGAKVHQKAMAPVGAMQVVFCSLPGQPGAQFTSGMGTITVTASPGIQAQNFAPNPFGISTAENSNMPYDLVPTGTTRLIAQPFGLPVTPAAPPVHPKIGNGLLGDITIYEPGGRIITIQGDGGTPIVIGSPLTPPTPRGDG